MSEINKTYRIKTDIGTKLKDDYITVDANLVQDYDTFDILSVKITSSDTYKLHNANYGVVVGRVLANNGFGVPNAKLSIFIGSDGEDGDKIRELYPFTSTASKDKNGVRYNLLPNEKVNDCHQVVGTFPSKRFALDNDVVLEVFDKYYKYTTRTNHAGDYLIMGVPVGTHTIHMDLDLSDCGILSQRPRDFVYKGYTVEQFENPNMFKNGTEYSNLSQIFTQDQVVNVQPFWGNASLGEKIGLTRADINVAFKFEPTCVFMGSVISDNSSHGISKKCIPTEGMGRMDELVTGSGTIEMIRKTPGGAIEEFQVKGTQVIDGNGVWCYQIPMNLDYMMTDEYGNMVPTDNPDIGIPTRTSVRFRISMQDNEENVDNYFRAKTLVPHNPQILEGTKYEDYDYEFGSLTRDESFRDLFWNNVYSVKSYIPRFQKRKVRGWKEKKFSGIKGCNFYGYNNPFPYNNMRIRLPFMFVVMCILIKVFVFLVSIINSIISVIGNFMADLGDIHIGWPNVKIFGWVLCWWPFKAVYRKALDLSMIVLKEGLCPDLENWFFSPMFRNNLWTGSRPPAGCAAYNLLGQTLKKVSDAGADDDPHAIDTINDEEGDEEAEPICLTIYTDYLIACIEMNLAMEYRVINFDFYNDWVNGTIYFPRFMRYVKVKKTFRNGNNIIAKSKIKGCMDDTSIFSKTRRYTQQCSMPYVPKTLGGKTIFSGLNNPIKKGNYRKANNLHKGKGFGQKTIFGSRGGICHEQTTLKGQYVYYMKPCEWHGDINIKTILFATDIILLGSLNDCDINGIPQAFKYLSSTSYIMPTNLALTNMETEGHLFTNNGTICDGNNSTRESDVRNGAKVQVMEPNEGLAKELLAFSGTGSSNYDIMYETGELSDIIALTEAAGISWNYTGPGQGKENPDKLYYPGGHFLGLSCLNSQTNIRSCLNLSRICELGANMSQRKEDVKAIDDEGNLKYIYTSPTGFISGNDIVGHDFRTMFATMNQKTLIANKINPHTGYKMYDMEYVRPNNFNGAFYNIVEGTDSPYNTKFAMGGVDDESKGILQKLGIAFGSSPDHDDNEFSAQTRTIEDASLDYYRFRMGLGLDDLTKNSQKQQRRFLVSSGKERYMPQYENSYYFYFGLKNGATAIEEFNKQFFSDCGNSKIIADSPTVEMYVDGELNMCTATADLVVSTNNLEVPYQYIEILSDVEWATRYDKNGNITDDGEGKSPKSRLLVIMNGDDEKFYDDYLNQTMFSFKDVPFGTYRVTIRDANDVVFSKTEKIGLDILSYSINVYDFNYDTNDNTYKPKGDDIHKGGYIKLENLCIEGLPEYKDDNESGTKLTIYATLRDDVNIKSKEEECSNGQNSEIILMCPSVGVYDLWVSYKCDGDEYDTVEMLITSFEIKDTSSLGLRIGIKGIYDKPMTHKTHPFEWWADSALTTDERWIDRVATFNESVIYSAETSTIGVFANGGTKVLWGLPQSAKNGIDKKSGTFSSEDAEVGGGYTLDDEYVSYPTYYYDKDNKFEEVTHFSSLVYNGTRVMGNYTLYLSGGSIYNKNGAKISTSSAVSATNSDIIIYKIPENKLSACSIHHGYGYIFKSIPDGDLQFLYYNKYESGLTINSKDEDRNNITDGIIYPSIVYPSIKRPFKVEANFFCWGERGVELTTDENGETTVSISNVEKSGKYEINVHNGITVYNKLNENDKYTNPLNYRGAFSGSSTMSFGILDSAVTLNLGAITKNDMFGVDKNNYEDRIVNCSGFYKDNILNATSGVDYYSYTITEGSPTDIIIKQDDNGENIVYGDFSNNVKTISDTIESDFADYVTITVNDKGRITEFKEVGGNENSSAEYYLLSASTEGNNDFVIRNNDEYVHTTRGNRTYYVMCTYDTGATYNNEGAPLIVTATVQTMFNMTFASCTFDIKNENGDNVKINYSNGYDTGNALLAIKELIQEKCAGKIIGVQKQYINPNYSGNWIDVVNKSIDFSKNVSYEPNKKVYYAVGVIKSEDNRTRLYKIYQNVVKTSTFKESDISISFKISGDTEYNVDYLSSVIEIKLQTDDGVKWRYNDENNKCEWIKISPTTGSGPTDITITVSGNETGKERSCKITFITEGDKNTKISTDPISIIQAAKSTSSEDEGESTT